MLRASLIANDGQEPLLRTSSIISEGEEDLTELLRAGDDGSDGPVSPPTRARREETEGQYTQLQYMDGGREVPRTPLSQRGRSLEEQAMQMATEGSGRSIHQTLGSLTLGYPALERDTSRTERSSSSRELDRQRIAMRAHTSSQNEVREKSWSISGSGDFSTLGSSFFAPSPHGVGPGGDGGFGGPVYPGDDSYGAPHGRPGSGKSGTGRLGGKFGTAPFTKRGSFKVGAIRRRLAHFRGSAKHNCNGTFRDPTVEGLYQDWYIDATHDKLTRNLVASSMIFFVNFVFDTVRFSVCMADDNCDPGASTRGTSDTAELLPAILLNFVPVLLPAVAWLMLRAERFRRRSELIVIAAMTGTYVVQLISNYTLRSFQQDSWVETGVGLGVNITHNADTSKWLNEHVSVLNGCWGLVYCAVVDIGIVAFQVSARWALAYKTTTLLVYVVYLACVNGLLRDFHTDPRIEYVIVSGMLLVLWVTCAHSLETISRNLFLTQEEANVEVKLLRDEMTKTLSDADSAGAPSGLARPGGVVVQTNLEVLTAQLIGIGQGMAAGPRKRNLGLVVAGLLQHGTNMHDPHTRSHETIHDPSVRYRLEIPERNGGGSSSGRSRTSTSAFVAPGPINISVGRPPLSGTTSAKSDGGASVARSVVTTSFSPRSVGARMQLSKSLGRSLGRSITGTWGDRQAMRQGQQLVASSSSGGSGGSGGLGGSEGGHGGSPDAGAGGGGKRMRNAASAPAGTASTDKERGHSGRKTSSPAQPQGMGERKQSTPRIAARDMQTKLKRGSSCSSIRSELDEQAALVTFMDIGGGLGGELDEERACEPWVVPGSVASEVEYLLSKVDSGSVDARTRAGMSHARLSDPERVDRFSDR